MPLECSTRRSCNSANWQFAKNMCAHQAAHGQILLVVLPLRAIDLGRYNVTHRDCILSKVSPRLLYLLHVIRRMHMGTSHMA